MKCTKNTSRRLEYYLSSFHVVPFPPSSEFLHRAIRSLASLGLESFKRIRFLISVNFLSPICAVYDQL